ncbi:MAG: ABC transporter, partial [Gammaproteobacteria bacterium]|nr:ABC transporter [Gammaproteobacteria bacterium]
PSFALVTSYPQHSITRNFQYMTIFPRAVGINTSGLKQSWQAKPFLQTVPRSWSETGVLQGAIDYNKDNDIVGPLTIGVSLTPKDEKKENAKQDNKAKNKTHKQRIVILGDGDFLANSYLGNQGNLSLGNNIINWISNDDSFIDIPSTSSPDTQINITELSGALIALFFLIILPLALLSSGILIWWKRRTA